MTPTVLFITFSKRGLERYGGDPSVIYRCFNINSELRRQGYQSYVCHADAVPKKIDPHIVIFHRPRYSARFKELFDFFSSATKLCDFDDLLFDVRCIDEHPAYLSGKTSKKLLLEETEKYYQALELFSYFSVSTLALERTLRQLLPSAHTMLVKNGIDPDWFAYGQQYLRRIPTDSKIISYFSGTGNHQADLNMVVESINEFLKVSPKAMVRIFGDLNVSAGSFSDRWKRVPSVRFHQLPKWIRQSWVNIAPLTDSRFNQCKSAIKFLESGIYSVPLVASPLTEYKDIVNSGLKVVNSNNWFETLSTLKNKEIYLQAQKDAFSTAKKETSAKNTQRLIQWIKRV